MAKDNTFIFVIIGIVVLLFIATHGNPLSLIKPQTPVQTSSISVTYYDAQGNVIKLYDYNTAMKGTFSIVQNSPTIYTTDEKGTVTDSNGNIAPSAPKQSFSLNNLISSFSIFTNTQTVRLYTISDTYIYAGTPNTNYGLSSLLGTGSTSWSGIAYFKFDFSSIPSNATIISAVFNAYRDSNSLNNNAQYTGFVQFNVPEASSTWNTIAPGGTTSWSGFISNPAIGYTGSGTDARLIVSLTSTDCLQFKDYPTLILSKNTLSTSGAGWLYSRETNPAFLDVTYQVTSCVPETCTSLGKNCGLWNDTCSSALNLNCGTPATGYVCNASGQQVLAPTASYQINVLNTGTAPYTNVKISSMTPNFQSYFPSSIYTLNSGQSNGWTSSSFDISAYHGVTFTATITGNNTYTGKLDTFQSSVVIP